MKSIARYFFVLVSALMLFAQSAWLKKPLKANVL